MSFHFLHGRLVWCIYMWADTTLVLQIVLPNNDIRDALGLPANKKYVLFVCPGTYGRMTC